MPFLAGQRLTATQLNDFTHDRPTWFIRNTAAQSLTNAAFTALVFNTDDNDSHNMHSTATNTDRVTISEAGLYVVHGGAGVAGDIDGTRIARITKNGTAIAGSGDGKPPPVATESGWAMTSWLPVQCAVNDILRVEFFHNAGAAINTSTTDYAQPRFVGMWIKP